MKEQDQKSHQKNENQINFYFPGDGVDNIFPIPRLSTNENTEHSI